PSLCPTISSVMKTGTCFRPSCTAIVCPTKLGKTVERRDHVLITCFLSVSFKASTFFIRWSSAKGPFFKLRPMDRPPFAIGDICTIPGHHSNYLLRSRTIYLLDCLLRCRVL